MPDQPDPKHDRPRLTRRDALAGAAVAGLGLVALRAAGRHPSSGLGHVEVGDMALDELYRVSRKSWIGPIAVRSDVPKKAGNVFRAVDQEVDWYYDGDQWEPLYTLSSSNPGLGFDTWRTPSDIQAVSVAIVLGLQSASSISARVFVDVDESGDGTPDYEFENQVASGISTQTTRSQTLLVPAGASYRIRNEDDPLGENTIQTHREYQ